MPVAHPDEPKQVVQLMETRIRSPDDEPYSTDGVLCTYWFTCKELDQGELKRLRFTTVLREKVFMMLPGTMAERNVNMDVGQIIIKLMTSGLKMSWKRILYG